MFTPILRAIGQLGDPRLLGVLLACVALSALAFGGLSAGCAWAAHHYLADNPWLAGHPWLQAAVSGVSGLAAVLAAAWLFMPLAITIGGMFQEPVCRAVERRWYPGLAPARGSGVAAQIWDGVVLGLRMIVYSLAGLLVGLLVPGFGLALGVLITGWGLGRGMFASVAFRRMGRAEALSRYQDQRAMVLAQGMMLALLGCVPLLNLLLPILGPAVMVHMILSGRHKIETWG
jgi:uncharacterized protein involved in cysteine biosynthesis